jgi:hypothetical protein
MAHNPIRKRLFTPQIIETNQSADLRAHSELAGRSDGSRWVEVGTDALPVSTYYHTSLVYAGKLWVIGGSTGAATRKVYYSIDGITWTEAGVDSLPVATYAHSSVVFNGKMWVIGGRDVATFRTVYYSTDGIVWTLASATALPLISNSHTSVVYDGKMWVIGGNTGVGIIDSVSYSSDGITWTQLSGVLPAGLVGAHTSVVYDGKMWVIGGIITGDTLTHKVLYSTNGSVWTDLGNVLSEGTWCHTSVVYNGKMWVIGGGRGANYTAPLTRIVYYSTDGSTWTQAGVNALPVATYYHSSVVYAGKMWVIGGYPGAATRKVYATIPQQSGLVTDGPVSVSRRAVGVTGPVLTTDYYLGCTAGAITLTLPAVADAYVGKRYVFKDETGVASASPIIIEGAGVETIDGALNYTLSSNYQSVSLICTGTAWAIT